MRALPMLPSHMEDINEHLLHTLLTSWNASRYALDQYHRVKWSSAYGGVRGAVDGCLLG